MANALPLKTNLTPTWILKPPAAGSAVQLTSAYADLGSSQQQFAYVRIRANPSNSSVVYIINQAGSADVGSFSNVLDIIAPGVASDFNLIPAQVFLPAQYFIDVAKTGDSAIAVLVQI